MDIKFEMVLPETPALADSAKQLFIEYARSLNFSLCFQDFDKELAGLPGDYVPPSGRLILAYEEMENSPDALRFTNLEIVPVR